MRGLRSVAAEFEAPLDVHLMIEAPDRYLEDFAEAGAALITVHQEACPHLHRTVQAIRELGVKAGVALNPATPLESLADILPDLDLLLVMTVNPGFGGQEFISEMVPKIQQADAWRRERNLRFRIEVDGGINLATSVECAKAGADTFVAGSAIFGAKDYKATIAAMRAALAKS